MLEARFAQAEMRMDRQFSERLAALEARFDERLIRLETRMYRFEDRLLQHLRWMIGLWMTSTVGILAVLVTLLRQGT